VDQKRLRTTDIEEEKEGERVWRTIFIAVNYTTITVTNI